MFAAATATVSFCATTVSADTLLVPSEFVTIQAAIDAAVDGDEIIVADGVYTTPEFADFDFLGKAVTVRSENGPDQCTIDPGPDRAKVKIENGEGADSVLAGITIVGVDILIKNDSSPTIDNCIFLKCPALIGNASPVFTDTMFDGARSGSGEMQISCLGDSSPAFIGCSIHNMSSAVGTGGINVQGGFLTLINCDIRNCLANGSLAHGGGFTPGGLGGGLRVKQDSAGALIVNCLFEGNIADGGFSIEFESPGGTGGAVAASDETTIINSTFVNNAAEPGYPKRGKVADDVGRGSAVWGLATMINCVVWDNFVADDTGGTATQLEDISSITYSIVQGGFAGEGNIDEDPLFKDAENGDYRLLPDSPAIDSGNAALLPADDFDLDDDGDVLESIPYDYDGLDRIVGRSVDMGAFEFQGLDPADLDEDGVVGPADLAQLLGNWGPCGDPRNCPEDLDGDGIVGPADLALLLGSWG